MGCWRIVRGARMVAMVAATADIACSFDPDPLAAATVAGTSQTGGPGPSTSVADGSPGADAGPTSAGGDTTTTTTTTGQGGTSPGELLPDCAAILDGDPGAQTGVFVIDPPGGAGQPVEVLCDMETDGGGWTRFWWWTPGTWPAAVTDVLQSPFGACEANAPYCFGRLPPLSEDATSLLAIDPQGPTKYRWDFDSANSTAHAAWLAFAEHTPIPEGMARDGDEWAPIELEGSQSPKAAQDCFMYRTEHGVASVLMDDDNCDDATSLQMGHGMCYGGWGTGSSAEFSYGVDRLRDPGPESGPRPDFHLELFYR